MICRYDGLKDGVCRDQNQQTSQPYRGRHQRLVGLTTVVSKLNLRKLQGAEFTCNNSRDGATLIKTNIFAATVSDVGSDSAIRQLS